MMAADPKDELHALIDQLDHAHAQDLLALVQSHVRTHSQQERYTLPQTHEVPVLHRASAITALDELFVPLFTKDETPEEIEETIRRWREFPENA